MGFFSKETVTCSVCGKQFETRLGTPPYVCPECAEAHLQKMQTISGYISYRDREKNREEDYTEADVDVISEHRRAILEKHRKTNGISRAELMEASQNFKKLTNDEARDVLRRVQVSEMEVTAGAGSAPGFFALADFDGVFVDAEDVFAVAYQRAPIIRNDGYEPLLCAIFTNDPYVPAFPMFYLGEMRMFEMTKSKAGRQAVEHFYRSMCPNLTYPLQEIKALKKQIKAEGTVKGNISMDCMIKQLDNARGGLDIYREKKASGILPATTTALLDEYGYIQDIEIDVILRMDKMINRNFWNKQLKCL